MEQECPSSVTAVAGEEEAMSSWPPCLMVELVAEGSPGEGLSLSCKHRVVSRGESDGFSKHGAGRGWLI